MTATPLTTDMTSNAYAPCATTRTAACAGWPILGSAVWPTEEQTQAMAQDLARAIVHTFSRPQTQAQPQGRLVLHGGLGAGKTTFVRHVLRALGVEGTIKSPTYAVVEPHQAGPNQGGFAIFHFDCYRFEDPQEWQDAGLDEIWSGPGLMLCEWPDRVAGLAHSADWQMHIQLELDAQSGESRRVQIQAQTPLGLSWLHAVNRVDT